MKKRHLLGVLPLPGGQLTICAAKGTKSIFRQRAAVIDFKRGIEESPYRLQPGGGVHQRGKRRGEGAHQVGVAEDRIAQRGLLPTVLHARPLDNIADFDVRRAGNLAAFAVDAVF